MEEQINKLWNFIKALESYTEDWDDFCDCGVKQGYRNGNHKPDCQTMKVRKDVEKLT